MFPTEVEFMTEDLVSNFRSGYIYHYVGSTFLNGYVNYIKPIKLYLLERYRTQGKIFEETVWRPFVEAPPFHTDLNGLDDDVFILGETNDHYYFFWYDCDCSDCAIGRQQKKNIKQEEAINWFDNYAERLVDTKMVEYRSSNREKLEIADECCEGISGYREIPLKCLRGWIKF